MIFFMHCITAGKESKWLIPDPWFATYLSLSGQFCFLAHLSRRLKGELIVYQSSRRLAVCLSVCVQTFSNLNISATSGPIITKFYLNHHWGGGKAALGFGLDQIGTLVSMATHSSHRVIMGKML